MMKHIMVLIFMFFLISPAFAANYTTIVGSSGLIRMPSGDVLATKQFNVGVDYCADIATGTGTINTKGVWSYKVNIGAFKGMELGMVGQTDRTTDRFKEGVFINMKYSLSSVDYDYNFPLKLAIGVENLTSYTDSDVYLVATKYFAGGWIIHLGAMFDFPNNKFRTLGMGGIEYQLGGAGSNVVILGEVFGGETLFQVDAGIRLKLFPRFNIKIDGLNLTKSTTSKNSQSVSAGICWENPF